MSGPRDALLGRFRARSLDRLQLLTIQLLELGGGRGDEALRREAARELHTLKGDSRVVGLEEVAELTHAAEERLRDGGAALPSAAACEAVQAALDAIARVLAEEVRGDDATRLLASARAVLAGATPASPPPLQSPSQSPSQSPPPPPSPSPSQPQSPSQSQSQSQPPSPSPSQSPAPSPSPSPSQSQPQSQSQSQPPSPSPSPSQSPPPPPQQSTERWVHVRFSRVDHLCERLDEFSADFRAIALRVAALARDEQRSGPMRALAEAIDRARAGLDDAVDDAWGLRLVPVEPSLQGLVRHARELAAQQGKQLRVVVRSQGAEVERAVLDDLWEPLLHLVRNAVDHGLERPEERADKPKEGTLELRASPRGDKLVLQIVDDGRGVDLAAVRASAAARGLGDAAAVAGMSDRALLGLLFLHGFSTRGTVTELSGRGVGLDVVRERLEALGGTATVESVKGRGTTFELTVPSTITRERTLVVECGGVLYGLPAARVLGVEALGAAQSVAGGEVVRFRDEALPLRSLARALGVASPSQPRWCVVVEAAGRRWALAVEELRGDEPLVRRPVDALLARLPNLAGSAVLDDGRLVLLLSLGALLRRGEGRAATAPVAGREGPPRVLVVDDSPTVTDLLRELLSEAGLEVESAADGERGLLAIETFRPRVVVSDVDMPVMDGFELLQRIRARWRELPVVMLTTRGSTEDRRRALALGASAYLVKTQFDQPALLETIRGLLGRAP